ncbi:AMP-binding protein [Flexibacterium corallicola]|uniref:AMP-binding protein n=1 Tax=Flexibacterium corallicola TaxID=3037259 RepID=UPI00286EEB93|nr:AMP-binding protein [Pseudovibrio sp. M1P-2-3]
MLPKGTTYEELYKNFSWNVPEFYNIGVMVCDRWAEREPDREAITVVGEAGTAKSYTYSHLKELSSRLCNLLISKGVERGDRVAILLPQTVETACSHIATYKMGAIALPLFTLFGEEALAFRLENSGAKILITNSEGAQKLSSIQSRLPNLQLILNIEEATQNSTYLYEGLEKYSSEFTPVPTKAEDPALIIYTSGTTGQPKGALHAHRTFIGHLWSTDYLYNGLPREGDRAWTPSDWAWIAGLLNILMPSLYYGIPVVAHRFKKFSGEAAFQLLHDQNITNAFLPPTALKMMRLVEKPEKRWNCKIRSITCGGETVGAEIIEWGRQIFGITISECYGQTECNLCIGTCTQLMEARPGLIGKEVPGFQVEIVDGNGHPLPPDTLGAIAVKTPVPIMMTQYWQNPEATKNKFKNGYLLTGDEGTKDADGWFRFVGRDDDVITSAGYRIGPGEIEDYLLKHPAVAIAGVIGKPNKERTEIVKAYVVLKKGHSGTQQLHDELQNFVKHGLAAYEYPREIEFVEDLPLTTTGKIIRSQLRARAKAELENK